MKQAQQCSLLLLFHLIVLVTAVENIRTSFRGSIQPYTFMFQIALARAALLQSCRWYNIYVPHIYNICQLIVGSRDTFLFRVLEVGWFPGGVGRGIIA